MSRNAVHTIGIVLLNLGGPDSLEAVRPFLYNLFSDREIIRLGPSVLQKPIAWLISTLRSKKTAEMYSLIGGKSPILDITKAQAEALEKALNKETDTLLVPPVPPPAGGDPEGFYTFKVYIGMRYWHPFINDTVQNMITEGVRDVVVLSLYPHYSKATTGSSVSDFKKTIAGKDLHVRYIDRWPDFPAYIDALAALIAEGISEFKDADCEILYSAHSLPQSFIDEGDPYLNHINLTIEGVTKRLSDAPYHIGYKWHLAFQSKTGPVKWLEPTTEETIENLAKGGCKNLLVVPISFVSDHIETLYEIDILYKEMAENHGIQLKRCKSLNTSEQFIRAMKDLILDVI